MRIIFNGITEYTWDSLTCWKWILSWDAWHILAWKENSIQWFNWIYIGQLDLLKMDYKLRICLCKTSIENYRYYLICCPGNGGCKTIWISKLSFQTQKVVGYRISLLNKNHYQENGSKRSPEKYDCHARLLACGE